MSYDDEIVFDKQSHLTLDPRTKIFLTLTISTILVAGGTTGLMGFISPVLASIPFVLLMFSKKFIPALKYLIVYSVLFLAEVFLIPTLSGIASYLLIAMIGVFSHMLPGFLMGYYFLTSTSISEFVCAMEKMKVSQKIIIPISVVFRFLPTIKEEYTSIRNAMKMRNILSFKKPLRVVEYTIIPLMMSIVKIGEELSASALTRGLGGTEKRTNICKIGFGAFDIVAIVISIFSWCIFVLS